MARRSWPGRWMRCGSERMTPSQAHCKQGRRGSGGRDGAGVFGCAPSAETHERPATVKPRIRRRRIAGNFAQVAVTSQVGRPGPGLRAAPLPLAHRRDELSSQTSTRSLTTPFVCSARLCVPRALDPDRSVVRPLHAPAPPVSPSPPTPACAPANRPTAHRAP